MIAGQPAQNVQKKRDYPSEKTDGCSPRCSRPENQIIPKGRALFSAHTQDNVRFKKPAIAPHDKVQRLAGRVAAADAHKVV